MPQENRNTVKQPALFVFATKDFVLTDDLTKGM